MGSLMNTALFSANQRRCSIEDLTKSSHKNEDLIRLLIEKRKILHVKSCPQNHVLSYLKQLEIPYDSKVSVEVLRLTLGKGMREIFQEQVKDARKIESLCDYVLEQFCPWTLQKQMTVQGA